MKNSVLRNMVVFVALSFAVSANAASVLPTVEFIPSYSSGIQFSGGAYSWYTNDTYQQRSKNIFMGLGALLSAAAWSENHWQLQAGAQSVFSFGWNTDTSGSSPADSSSSTILLIIGPRLNWAYDGNLQSAVFGGVAAGFQRTSSYLDSTSRLNLRTRSLLQVELGKRFMLAEHVSYSPAFLFQKVEDSTTIFSVTPLAFSLFF